MRQQTSDVIEDWLDFLRPKEVLAIIPLRPLPTCAERPTAFALRGNRCVVASARSYWRLTLRFVFWCGSIFEPFWEFRIYANELRQN